MRIFNSLHYNIGEYNIRIYTTFKEYIRREYNNY